MNEPIRMDLLFCFCCSLFGKPPMWRFVIRFAFLVSGQKHERRRKSVKYFNFSHIPLFFQFFPSTGFQLFFDCLA